MDMRVVCRFKCHNARPDTTPRVRQYLRAGDGFIARKDGFTATSFTPDQFRSLAADLPASLTLTEVDGSNLFCILRKSGPADKSHRFNV